MQALPPTMPTIQEIHIAHARKTLAEACHWYRFFGQAIAGFSPEHNRLRAEANRAHVKAVAFQAGVFCAYAEMHPAAELSSSPAWNVTDIRDAVFAGWRDTLQLLGSKDDLTVGPSGGPE